MFASREYRARPTKKKPKEIDKATYFQLRRLYKSIDVDKTEFVELHEFTDSLNTIENRRIRKALLEQSEELFNRLDANKDGYITWEEMLLNQYPHMTVQEIRVVINKYDRKHTTLKMVKDTLVQRKKEVTEDEVQEFEEVFMLYSNSELGGVAFPEFLAYFGGSATGLDECDLHPMFEQADMDGDGVLNREEFVQLMRESVEEVPTRNFGSKYASSSHGGGNCVASGSSIWRRGVVEEASHDQAPLRHSLRP